MPRPYLGVRGPSSSGTVALMLDDSSSLKRGGDGMVWLALPIPMHSLPKKSRSKPWLRLAEIVIVKWREQIESCKQLPWPVPHASALTELSDLHF